MKIVKLRHIQKQVSTGNSLDQLGKSLGTSFMYLWFSALYFMNYKLVKRNGYVCEVEAVVHCSCISIS